ncbi:endonuclease/exonuclease/phosphatase family protein [Edaphobacillus lindanitolerans]|uniref:Metal-dependent hydrolase, endonuclease/exonuclease/phosphatase family n=1 Tax=Edaphobacillus lindanitolerans TaxID=550447 RepID=A0A1U7PKD1_9BACI|nr:endonuclease/exonuclease/phosphatase family protein [Edaphobacillus lindanitolerans]SIT84602.1 Metal-dependent hydrolase, endonuclease/exonuclease/phosphatase family [Edaphobacillus lindanitolerans]
MNGDPAGNPIRQHYREDRNRPDTVRVMSFNMAHGMGMDGHVDLTRTAEVIRASGADIIGLQEVDSHFSERSGFEDQAARLADMLGMHFGFGANLVEAPAYPGMPHGKYGNAVLSRYPIKYAVNHPLSDAGLQVEDPEPRGILEAFIDLGNTYLNFFTTHMSLSDSALRAGIGRLMKLTDRSLFPTVVTGDFNADPDHSGIVAMGERFNEVFRKAGAGCPPTFPSRSYEEKSGIRTGPYSKIDYIFTDLAQTVTGADVIDTSVSDHLPIVADLLMLPVFGSSRSEKPNEFNEA